MPYGIYPRKSAVDRFWSKVDKGPHPKGCWLWTAGCYPNGYGMFWFNGKNTSAHRFSFELHKGKLLPGFEACHHCDIHPCVHPDHLFSGTQLDNMADAVSKGHRYQGTVHHKCKLSEEDVRYIRYLKGTLSQREIADIFMVTQTLIGYIHRGLIWKHLA